jgi:hypothetical protein
VAHVGPALEDVRRARVAQPVGRGLEPEGLPVAAHDEVHADRSEPAALLGEEDLTKGKGVIETKLEVGLDRP